MPVALFSIEADLCLRYAACFDELFVHGRPEAVVALVEEILTPGGGFLFDGHRLDAPANYRKALA